MSAEVDAIVEKILAWRQMLTGVPAYAPDGKEFSPAFLATVEMDEFLKTNLSKCLCGCTCGSCDSAAAHDPWCPLSNSGGAKP